MSYPTYRLDIDLAKQYQKVASDDDLYFECKVAFVIMKNEANVKPKYCKTFYSSLSMFSLRGNVREPKKYLFLIKEAWRWKQWSFVLCCKWLDERFGKNNERINLQEKKAK